MPTKRMTGLEILELLQNTSPRHLSFLIDTTSDGVPLLPLEFLKLLQSDGNILHPNAQAFLEKVYTWPGGTLATIKRKCTNSGATTGSQSIKIEPAADSPVIIHRASLVHDDGTNRTLSIYIYTSGGGLCYLLCSASKAAAAMLEFPQEATLTSDTVALIHPDFEFELKGASLAISKITEFYLQYSYIGTAPTITETGPSGSAYSDVA